MTWSRPKALPSERDEEVHYALQAPIWGGFLLQSAHRSQAQRTVARKQGKIWAWASHLRADERDLLQRDLMRLSQADIRLWASDGATLLAMNSGTKLIRLVPQDPRGLVSRAAIGDQEIVVTCLPGTTEPCDPALSSVIEFKTRTLMSNHRPRVVGFLYGETGMRARLSGRLATDLGQEAAGKIRFISVLNRDFEMLGRLELEAIAERGQLNLVAAPTPDGQFHIKGAKVEINGHSLIAPEIAITTDSALVSPGHAPPGQGEGGT